MKTIMELNKAQQLLSINFEGELTFTSHISIEDFSEKNSEIKKVTVNLAKCDYIDSAGLGLLLVLRDIFKLSSKIRIENANDLVSEKLRITNFHKLFNVT